MLFAGAITLPIIFGTLAYLIIAINRYVTNPRRTFVAGMLLLFPICMTLLIATYFNAIPRRITPESVKASPFDRYFE